MKKHKNKIIFGAVVAAVLAFAFWYGGNTPGLRGGKTQPEESVKAVQSEISEPTKSDVPNTEPTEKENGETEQTASEPQKEEADEPAAVEGEPQNTDAAPMTEQENAAPAESIAESPSPPVEVANEAYSKEYAVRVKAAAEKDEYQTEPVPESRPAPIEPQDAVISDKALTCTLSVRCDSILDNMAWLDAEKAELVPKDGVIYAEKTVTFYEGESVFNLLLREMKQNKIHMEYENTPVYNSAYIEGIGNLYEFDCGELSGWMYKVNGWFPNYGCSRYRIMPGDRVEWAYTCDLGEDIGGNYSARNGK